jgi:hypothetical protein
MFWSPNLKEKRETELEKKKQQKQRSISPILIEKIEKLGVKVFLLTRRVPLIL